MKKPKLKSSLNFISINQAAFLPNSEANGPGNRAVIWVQGCPRRCPGCSNPGMQNFENREIVSVKETARRILAIKGIEGVTFSGGEPFSQAEALGELGQILRKAGLTVLVFTGYTLAEIKSSSQRSFKSLLECADLLVAGPYVKELPSNRYLCGSDNQELVFLTDRLKFHPDLENRGGHLMEFNIDQEGNIIFTGIGC